jgi:hypothetical protein
MIIRENQHFYLLLFLGTVAVLFASQLAPFASKVPSPDSSVFIYCAQQILDGKIMYKEIFDHKGPLLYVFNILGILLGKGNSSGIWYIEVVSLFVSLLYIYKSICLFWSKDIAFFSAFSCLLFFISAFRQGNLAEEYSILFISISLYYFVHFFKERKIRRVHFSIIAVCFVCVLLLKATGVAIWLVGWLMVAFLLLKEKKITDLLKIALVTLGMIILTLLPFTAYLFFTNSFVDFKFCYWDFNQAYSNLSSNSCEIIYRTIKRFFFSDIKRLYSLHILLCLSIILFIFYFFNKAYKDKLPILFYFISLIATGMAISISSTNFLHYYLLYLPVLPCFYAMIYNIIKQRLKSHVFLFLSIFLFIFHTIPMLVFYKEVRFCFQKQEFVNEIVSFIEDHTQKEDNIYIVGHECIFYNLSHRESASKYPYLFPIVAIKSQRDTIMKQFYRDMEVNQPKVICKKWYSTFWMEHGDLPITEIDAFLEKNYLKVQNIGGFDCYLRKALR